MPKAVERQNFDYGDIALNEIKVAQILGVSPGLLRKQRREKTGIPFIKVGYSVRYMRTAVDKYIADQLAANN